MKQPFEPLNDLERALVAALQNQMPVPAFVQTLLRSRVYLLTEKPIPAGEAWHPGATPMVLADARKTPYLAIFTAPERSTAWAQRQTSYGCGLSTDFSGVLQGMASDLGIVINPGLPAGFELQPATVAQLKAQAG
ncbi:MAG: SseB family protein [Hylemonella sp.]|uniref:SseB family protein n=1 Tax=Hylemonella sp. TaxID=2066020 RepID=UPI0022BBC2D9|nr:SseB family protein [Hylemonella sp.]MCZ8250983.1 SseB family protein [Hylemonella sp.]